MNDYKLWAGVSVAVAIGVIAVATVFTQEAAPAIELIAPTIPEIAPVIIKVDQVDCVIAEEPTLTYYTTTNTVRVTIECDSGLIYNYMPAIKGVTDAITADEQQNEFEENQEPGEIN